MMSCLKDMKSHFSFTTKFFRILLHLLFFYSFLTQLWISLQVIDLSGAAKPNHEPERDSNNCVFECH